MGFAVWPPQDIATLTAQAVAAANSATAAASTLIYNIKSYGGTGNGVASDDTALTTTLANITGGGSLILPLGSWKVSNFTMPADTEIQADRNAKFTTAVDITWPDIGVEYGVIYPYFAKGDVRRYGVFPDGVTNWEGTYPARMTAIYKNACNPNITCRFPPGFYATGMNFSGIYSNLKFHMESGAEFGSILHFISSAAPVNKSISSITRASGVVTVTTAGSHGFTPGSIVRIIGVKGGTTDFNGEDITVATVPTSTTLTFAQAGADESGTVSSTGAYLLERALRNVKVTGKLVSYDRIGTINLIDSFFDGLIVRSNPAKQIAYPGTKARGIHIYSFTDNVSFGDVLIEDCGTPNNTDAALAIDGGAAAPRRCKFGKVHVKASDVHGAYICGFSHTFEELRIDEFSAAQNVNVLQDSDGLAQSQEGKGVWFNRCSGIVIETLRINQSTIPRANAFYHLMVDETGISTVNDTRARGVHVGRMILRNVMTQGASIGDRNYPATNEVHLHVDVAELQLATGATLTSGYQGLHLNKNSGDSRLHIGKVDFLDFVAQLRMKTAAGTVFSFSNITDRAYSTTNNNGQLLEAQGVVLGGTIQYSHAGGSTAAPLIYLNGAGASDSIFQDINIVASVATNTPSLKILSASRVTINKMYTYLMRNATANIELNGITSCTLNNVNLVSTGGAGTGVVLNVLTDCLLTNWSITGFSKGVDQFGTAAITRCTAINCNISGNTTQTDVQAASFTVLNAASIQN